MRTWWKYFTAVVVIQVRDAGDWSTVIEIVIISDSNVNVLKLKPEKFANRFVVVCEWEQKNSSKVFGLTGKNDL